MTNRGFTEAVPLSLSSMAHMTMPLEEGVLDGLKQVIQHTLLSCVNYARAMHVPHNFTFRDLTTSPYAWEPIQQPAADKGSLPPSLTKLGFQHQYHRTAFIYLKKNNEGKTATSLTKEQELDLLTAETSWTPQANILGRITLQYATTALMTEGELNGTEKDDDTPKCVLFKVLVEYRSLPATGNKAAVQAEELSMLSFGGSVDDDVKYGALAALYDRHAKYVLEIYSVRGKKYKFDLMDSTLSDGTVPRLPSRNGMNARNGTANNSKSKDMVDDDDQSISSTSTANKSQDPFVKSLCVTVTDHVAEDPPKPPPAETEKEEEKVEEKVEAVVLKEEDAKKEETEEKTDEETKGDDEAKEDKKEEAATKTTTTSNNNTKPQPQPRYALTKIHLTLEGNLRMKTPDNQDLPSPNLFSDDIQATFLALNHQPPDMATAAPSGHTLLLDPKEAGKVYINGRYVTTWGNDPRIGSHFPALFGMDLHSIPYWHGRIFDFDVLKRNYAQLWQEILIDARLVPMNIGGRLLSRFISGKDPVKDDEDDDDDEELLEDDDDDDEELLDEDDEEGGDGEGGGGNPKRVDTGIDSLESQVMQSTKYDPVGISAKALATKFKIEYGDEGFPCLAHEIDWVKDRLPGRVPVAVPQRLINVLRRGGYFDTKRTSDEVWFSESRPAGPAEEGEDAKSGGEAWETELVNKTVELLKAAGCNDVHANMIVFFNGEGITDPVQKKGLVRFNRSMRQYHVHEHFLKMDLANFMQGNDTTNDDDDDMDDDAAAPPCIPERAHLLGLHIAQEHQDGSVLLKYMLKHANIVKQEEEKKDDDDDDATGEPSEKKRKI